MPTKSVESRAPPATVRVGPSPVLVSLVTGAAVGIAGAITITIKQHLSLSLRICLYIYIYNRINS